MKLRIGCAVIGFLSLVVSLAAQTLGSSSVPTQVPPPLIQFSNVATDEGGNPLSGVVSITFSLYSSQQGGQPLWTETQNNIQLDPTGHYSVQLGITRRAGVAATLFTTGQARWLGVRIAEQAEQPRVLLVSVPYALKAGDAATIGGLPPSAFVLAAPQHGASSMSSAEFTGSQGAPPPSNPVTGTGTVKFLPLWDTTSDIISSTVFQSGTGSTARVGINTTTPASTLDVKGAGTIRGLLSLPSTGTATATKGFNSQALSMAASVFNSGLSKAVNQTFHWQAEAVANDTSSPSGTLNLLFGSGTTPTETGLYIAGNGQITFAAGQTFPGTGDGTITGITTAAGSGLIGGGTSGNLNLALTNSCATNQILQWNGSTWACTTIGGGGTITGVTAGTDLTGGGTSGTVTLNLDTTKVPLLASANTFTQPQQINAGSSGLTASVSNPSGVGVSSTVSAGAGTGVAVQGLSAALSGVGVSGSGGLVGVYGSTFGSGGSANGVQGASTNATAVRGDDAGSGSGVVGTSAAGYGVSGSGGFVGVYGVTLGSGGSANGVQGASTNATAVRGDDSGSGTGVVGTSTKGYGVFGLSSNLSLNQPATGVVGRGPNLSSMGSQFGPASINGVWGDGGVFGTGVFGTSDEGPAGTFLNKSELSYALQAQNDSATGNLFSALNVANNNYCVINYGGHLSCSGGTHVVVPIDRGARKVALSAIESPKNWFEDFGSAQLASGSAVVMLDSDFIQTVNSAMEYHVFLTPNGDCNGLYATQKTATSFEVHELHGGSSSVAFDYRIVALRTNYENIRFEDHTNDPDPRKQTLRGQPGNPASQRESAMVHPAMLHLAQK